MSDHVKFSYSVPLVGASEYQFERQPKTIDFWWEKESSVDRLADGTPKEYFRGFRIYAELKWEPKRIVRYDQLHAFRRIYNLHTGISFQPFPMSRPDAVFGMSWIQKSLNFHLVEGVSPIGYYGSIELVGTRLYSEIPDNWITGDL